ncbi:MAG TPA: hypothetical protein VHV54_23330 [Candidatus Binatia bacterium]|nr:hypothetical protein [Candidatus Binatia bacterium]
MRIINRVESKNQLPLTGRLAPLQIAWQEEANDTRRNQVNPLVSLSLSRVKENFDGGTTTLAAPIFH